MLVNRFGKGKMTGITGNKTGIEITAHNKIVSGIPLGMKKKVDAQQKIRSPVADTIVIVQK